MLPTHKATGREEDLCLPAAGGLTLTSPQPGEGLEAAWKDFSHLAAVMWILDLLGKAGVTPGRSWQSQNHHLAEKPQNLLSLFLASTQRTGCQCSFYFLTPKAQPHVSVCRKSSQHLSSPIIYKPGHEKTIL